MLLRPLPRLILLVAPLIAADVLVTPATAQQPTADPAKPPARAGDARDRQAVGALERKFTTEAAMGGIYEVEAGQLAATKASSQEVKSFAQRMVTDHGKANEELKRIAASKNMQLPTQIDRKQRSELDRLGKLSGSEFDRAYMQHMVQDHEKDVAEFRKAAKELQDADLKEFASSSLPTLEGHLRMAEQTADKVKGSR
jgi:putative membrane protein